MSAQQMLIHAPVWAWLQNAPSLTKLNVKASLYDSHMVQLYDPKVLSLIRCGIPLIELLNTISDAQPIAVRKNKSAKSMLRSWNDISNALVLYGVHIETDMKLLAVEGDVDALSEILDNCFEVLQRMTSDKFKSPLMNNRSLSTDALMVVTGGDFLGPIMDIYNANATPMSHGWASNPSTHSHTHTSDAKKRSPLSFTHQSLFFASSPTSLLPTTGHSSTSSPISIYSNPKSNGHHYNQQLQSRGRTPPTHVGDISANDILEYLSTRLTYIVSVDRSLGGGGGSVSFDLAHAARTKTLFQSGVHGSFTPINKWLNDVVAELDRYIDAAKNSVSCTLAMLNVFKFGLGCMQSSVVTVSLHIITQLIEAIPVDSNPAFCDALQMWLVKPRMELDVSGLMSVVICVEQLPLLRARAAYMVFKTAIKMNACKQLVCEWFHIALPLPSAYMEFIKLLLKPLASLDGLKDAFQTHDVTQTLIQYSMSQAHQTDFIENQLSAWTLLAELYRMFPASLEERPQYLEEYLDLLKHGCNAQRTAVVAVACLCQLLDRFTLLNNQYAAFAYKTLVLTLIRDQQTQRDLCAFIATTMASLFARHKRLPVHIMLEPYLNVYGPSVDKLAWEGDSDSAVYKNIEFPLLKVMANHSSLRLRSALLMMHTTGKIALHSETLHAASRELFLRCVERFHDQELLRMYISKFVKVTVSCFLDCMDAKKLHMHSTVSSNVANDEKVAGAMLVGLAMLRFPWIVELLETVVNRLEQEYNLRYRDSSQHAHVKEVRAVLAKAKQDPRRSELDADGAGSPVRQQSRGEESPALSRETSAAAAAAAAAAAVVPGLDAAGAAASNTGGGDESQLSVRDYYKRLSSTQNLKLQAKKEEAKRDVTQPSFKHKPSRYGLAHKKRTAFANKATYGDDLRKKRHLALMKKQKREAKVRKRPTGKPKPFQMTVNRAKSTAMAASGKSLNKSIYSVMSGRADVNLFADVPEAIKQLLRVQYARCIDSIFRVFYQKYCSGRLHEKDLTGKELSMGALLKMLGKLGLMGHSLSDPCAVRSREMNKLYQRFIKQFGRKNGGKFQGVSRENFGLLLWFVCDLVREHGKTEFLWSHDFVATQFRVTLEAGDRKLSSEQLARRKAEQQAAWKAKQDVRMAEAKARIAEKRKARDDALRRQNDAKASLSAADAEGEDIIHDQQFEDLNIDEVEKAYVQENLAEGLANLAAPVVAGVTAKNAATRLSDELVQQLFECYDLDEDGALTTFELSLLINDFFDCLHFSTGKAQVRQALLDSVQSLATRTSADTITEISRSDFLDTFREMAVLEIENHLQRERSMHAELRDAEIELEQLDDDTGALEELLAHASDVPEGHDWFADSSVRNLSSDEALFVSFMQTIKNGLARHRLFAPSARVWLMRSVKRLWPKNHTKLAGRMYDPTCDVELRHLAADYKSPSMIRRALTLNAKASPLAVSATAASPSPSAASSSPSAVPPSSSTPVVVSRTASGSWGDQGKESKCKTSVSGKHLFVDAAMLTCAHCGPVDPKPASSADDNSPKMHSISFNTRGLTEDISRTLSEPALDDYEDDYGDDAYDAYDENDDYTRSAASSTNVEIADVIATASEPVIVLAETEDQELKEDVEEEEEEADDYSDDEYGDDGFGDEAGGFLDEGDTGFANGIVPLEAQHTHTHDPAPEAKSTTTSTQLPPISSARSTPASSRRASLLAEKGPEEEEEEKNDTTASADDEDEFDF